MTDLPSDTEASDIRTVQMTEDEMKAYARANTPLLRPDSSMPQPTYTEMGKIAQAESAKLGYGRGVPADWGPYSNQPLTHDAQAIALLSEVVTLLRDIRALMTTAAAPEYPRIE